MTSSKKHIAPISNGNVSIRLICEDDIEIIRNWRNNDEIRLNFKNSDIISFQQQREWFLKYYADSTDYFFMILFEENQSICPVGAVALYSILDTKAEFGRCMMGNSEKRNRGVFFKACKLLFNIANFQLALSELKLEVFLVNERAIHVYKQLGFVETGRDELFLFMRLLNPSCEIT
ncbi:MAG: GNAT family N-acetyltransferase [Candidatus Riflebacteria bacterium]|nr:GNAT family N-acetyltransferase [Candidatus Riflebacteria bacterium]